MPSDRISNKRRLALIVVAAVLAPFFIAGFIGGLCFFTAAVGVHWSGKMIDKLLEGYQ